MQTTAELVVMSDGALLWAESTQLADAPLMVFIHGGPGMWDYLEPVAVLFRDEMSTLRYDQRGCGRSSPNDDYRMSRFVADLDELREHLGAESCWVLGHSFGADLALAYAAAHPERVEAMILANGKGLDWNEFRAEYHRTADGRRTPTQQRRLEDLEDLGKSRGRPRTAEEEVEWRVLHFLPDFADPTTAWSLALEDARAPFSINADCNRILNAETNALGPDAERAQCIAATMPVLIIHGAADPRPIDGVRRQADALPHAELAVLPGCAHQPWRERPDQFRAVLRAFLTQHI